MSPKIGEVWKHISGGTFVTIVNIKNDDVFYICSDGVDRYLSYNDFVKRFEYNQKTNAKIIICVLEKKIDKIRDSL